MPLHLPRTPRKRQCRFDSGVITLDARCKSRQFERGTLGGSGQPPVQSACLSLLDHPHKVLSQLIEVLQISIAVADAREKRSLVCRELCLLARRRSPPRPRLGAAFVGLTRVSASESAPQRWYADSPGCGTRSRVPQLARVLLVQSLANQLGCVCRGFGCGSIGAYT